MSRSAQTPRVAKERDIPELAALWAEAFQGRSVDERTRELREGMPYGSLADCLNTFLEPSTARHFNDLFVEATVDLSHVNYLLTANDPTRLPATVRDRLTPIVMPQPEEPHLPQIARSIVADLARENPLGEAWVAPLENWELAIAEELWRGGSVRRLSRIVRSILIQRQCSPRKH